MDTKDFTRIFLSNIKAGDKVLDLGAGSGDFSRMFVNAGASVTAVDIHAPKGQEEFVDSKRMSVEDFVALNQSGQYDLVFMRNILQFLDKNWTFENLIPWLNARVKNGGVVGIETFYHEPEPPFDHPMRSLYTVQELARSFLSWQELYCEEHKSHGPDMNGTMRDFYISDLIVRKPA